MSEKTQGQNIWADSQLGLHGSQNCGNFPNLASVSTCTAKGSESHTENKHPTKINGVNSTILYKNSQWQLDPRRTSKGHHCKALNSNNTWDSLLPKLKNKTCANSQLGMYPRTANFPTWLPFEQQKVSKSHPQNIPQKSTKHPQFFPEIAISLGSPKNLERSFL